jgi:hypothetical protein
MMIEISLTTLLLLIILAVLLGMLAVSLLASRITRAR